MFKLVVIKAIHTLIWLFFNVIIFYLLFAVLSNKIDMYVWLGISAIILEGIVLLIFKTKCPLTLVARKYSDSTEANFDIYLPKWLAKYNKEIYTSIFVVVLLLLAYRLFT